MTIHDLYSQRNMKPHDVLSYDSMTEKLKIQIEHIWKNYFLQIEEDIREEIWKTIHSALCEVHGKKSLFPDSFGTRYFYSSKVEHYFDEITSIDEILDVIEIVFRWINKIPKFSQQAHFKLEGNYKPEQAIKDLNARFLENGIGYEFHDRNIIRVDNTILHNDIIIETFQFLSTPTFKNANDEFLSAHEHFRHKRQKECLTDCLKALETTMKIICQENGWQYNKSDTAKQLIDNCIKNKLIPDFLLSHFNSLRTSIESGVPTIRNKLSGHGQGTTKIIVPDHYASYMLYLTGTTINFLVSCHREIKPPN